MKYYLLKRKGDKRIILIKIVVNYSLTFNNMFELIIYTQDTSHMNGFDKHFLQSLSPFEDKSFKVVI